MVNPCRTCTKCGSQKLDRELFDLLAAISVVSRRIADRLSAVSNENNVKGDDLNGKSKRIIHACGRN